jgi:hypothetical protein
MRKTLALAVAAVALTGCGMLPGQPGGGGGEEKQQTTAQQQPTTEQQPTQEQTTTDEPQQSAPPQEGAVVATRETDVAAGSESGRARVDITALKRQGKTVSLNWTVTVLDGKVHLHNSMGGGAFDYTVSAVSLIDPVNAKRYRVARNGTGADATCVCSGTQGQFLEKNEKASHYAVFAAPPADVTKINVEMPLIGVLTDVPLS